MELWKISVVFTLALLVPHAFSQGSYSRSRSNGAFTAFSSSLKPAELESCADPNTPTCDWYTRCIEKAHPCGPNGYVLGFGHRYCLKFGEAKDLSPLGDQWRDKTMICLQKALVPMLGASGSPADVCSEIETAGFDSHVKCYTDSPSICSLPWADIWKIADIIGPGFLDPHGWSQATQAVKICLCEWSGMC